MKQVVLALSLFFVSTTFCFSQNTLYGVDLPPKLKINKSTLILNGVGVRNQYFVNIYVAGLYLQEKSKVDKEIINADKSMALRIQVISSLITSERLIEYFQEGFDRSLNGKTDAVATQIEMFVRLFKYEPVIVGDYFELVFTPKKGVTVLKNGKEYVTKVPGLNFKKALFGIWLCPNSIDNNLKMSLLGF